jgi:hypothetical protein
MFRYVVIAAAASMLQGCLVFIPGQAIDAVADAATGNEGQNCVPAIAKVGDRIKLADGRIGKVAKLEGTTSRCTDPAHPVRALLTFQ